MILVRFHSFPIFLKLTLHWQKSLFSIFWCFRNPNDVQMTWKFTSISFWNEQSVGAKEAKKWKPEGQKRGAHAARFLGRVGPTILGLEPPMTSIFFPEPRLDLKPTIKIVSRRLSEGRPPKTQKHRNRDLELQIGEGKLRQSAAGVVSISPNDISTVSMIKRE